MRINSLRRGIRATALAFLTLAPLAARLRQGRRQRPDRSAAFRSGAFRSGAFRSGPEGSWPGPAPVGHVIYAVDLANNFLVFGSESINVLTAKMKITGLPILKRIIGITIRPSDGTLTVWGTTAGCTPSTR